MPKSALFACPDDTIQGRWWRGDRTAGGIVSAGNWDPQRRDETVTGFATRAVHAGEHGTRPPFTPTSTPIYASSSFTAPSPEDLDAVFSGERAGYVYSRYANPTTNSFEEAVAALEEADTAVAFGSGMAALHAALIALEVRAGDCVLAARDLYGATHTLLQSILTPLGLRVETMPMADPAAVGQRCREQGVRVVLLETISNPLLHVADVPAIVAAARAAGALVVVDNTFATPYLCRPLAWGADAVVHSVTKYLAGHGDVTAGVVCAGDELATPLRMTLRLVGAVLSPFESWLALRGLKTMPLRMRQHCAGAAAVAVWLGEQPQVARVYYPGLACHPDHAIAERLFAGRGYGGVVAFDLVDASREAAFNFLRKIRLVLPATTLGDVYSLALYPAMSSHRGLSPAARQAAGIGDGLLRLAVGIEDVEDILADLAQALQSGESR